MALQHRQQGFSTPPSLSHSATSQPGLARILPYHTTPAGTSTASSSLTPYHKSTRSRSGSHTSGAAANETASTALTPYHAPVKVRGGSPVKTTILDREEKSRLGMGDGDTITSVTSPTSYGTQLPPDDLYCFYASELQRHHTQALSGSVTSDPTPHCPHCKTSLHLSPGKAWEICKEDNDFDRCFHVSNRFVVKCHRAGPDGQYACVLCTVNSPSLTICGDVKALIKHIWEDHSIRELKREVDISEVIEQHTSHRRDSGMDQGASRSSRRSRSVASSRGRRSWPGFEREVDVFESRSFRKHA